MWITPKEYQKAVSTIIDVQRNNRTLDQDVQKAIAVLDNFDVALLTDNHKIQTAFLKTVGSEYHNIFEEQRDIVLAKAKFEIGNDMSTWSASDLNVLQKLFKRAQQEKAKKEKLEVTKASVASMKESDLRSRIVAFLDAHPEFCDHFNN